MRAFRAETLDHLLTHECMCSANVLHRRRQPRANCPNRFISNDRVLGIHTIWQRTSKLFADHVKRTLRFALIGSLADANDCNQSGCPCGFDLGENNLIAFLMVGPTLR